MTINYSNPVKELTILDWPYGRFNRVKCVFSIEDKKGKQRAVKTTDNPKGGTNKPKKLTYAVKVLFVTGSDDKTYVLELNQYGSISVMQSNFRLEQETMYSDDSRFETLRTFFEEK